MRQQESATSAAQAKYSSFQIHQAQQQVLMLKKQIDQVQHLHISIMEEAQLAANKLYLLSCYVCQCVLLEFPTSSGFLVLWLLTSVQRPCSPREQPAPHPVTLIDRFIGVQYACWRCQYCKSDLSCPHPPIHLPPLRPPNQAQATPLHAQRRCIVSLHTHSRSGNQTHLT